MLIFPLEGLLDEEACYAFLLRALHPDGLACPRGHALPAGQAPHDRHRAPVVDYRCRTCGAVYNVFTGTILSKSRYRPSVIVQILRGVAQAASPRGYPRSTWPPSLASTEATCSSGEGAFRRSSNSGFSPLGQPDPLKDRVVEADELYQNAGEKGRPHPDPTDPPRRRANKARGHGTWENDRPPIAGVVGRESKSLCLQLCRRSDRATLEPFVEKCTRSGTVVNTDEWGSYGHLEALGRQHRTVCHGSGPREWARDDDGDGIREVHDNTIEGIWTGLRNFLRPFRGVSKWYLSRYVAVFVWAYNLKRVTMGFLRAMLVPLHR